jgi:hypothetical protein
MQPVASIIQRSSAVSHISRLRAHDAIHVQEQDGASRSVRAEYRRTTAAFDGQGTGLQAKAAFPVPEADITPFQNLHRATGPTSARRWRRASSMKPSPSSLFSLRSQAAEPRTERRGGAAGAVQRGAKALLKPFVWRHSSLISLLKGMCVRV